jgi:purine-cytosine permease-like protein
LTLLTKGVAFAPLLLYLVCVLFAIVFSDYWANEHFWNKKKKTVKWRGQTSKYVEILQKSKLFCCLQFPMYFFSFPVLKKSNTAQMPFAMN